MHIYICIMHIHLRKLLYTCYSYWSHFPSPVKIHSAGKTLNSSRSFWLGRVRNQSSLVPCWRLLREAFSGDWPRWFYFWDLPFKDLLPIFDPDILTHWLPSFYNENWIPTTLSGVWLWPLVPALSPWYLLSPRSRGKRRPEVPQTLQQKWGPNIHLEYHDPRPCTGDSAEDLAQILALPLVWVYPLWASVYSFVAWG